VGCHEFLGRFEIEAHTEVKTPVGRETHRCGRRPLQAPFQGGAGPLVNLEAQMTGTKRVMLALCGALVACACGLAVGAASGQDLERKLNATQAKLEHANRHAGILTTRISHESAQIDRLTTEVAELRNKEAAVAAELAQKQAELDQAQARLDYLKRRLRDAITILEQRLVAIYQSNEPDLITVLLQADGFEDLLARTAYEQTLHNQDNDIVARVRELRNEVQATVNQIRAARDAIAARKHELEVTRISLKARTAELAAARRKQHATLEAVRKRKDDLEGDLSAISQKIAEQLAQGTGALPAGPIRPGGHGLIWPVNGPVVSGFGMRWGRMHEGIDIAVPTGTQIRAAASGAVEIAGYEGGYGNYTCIGHSGGLSTCYAHQSQILVGSGSVAQGQVIGLVGCTGHCFGPHLHFEIRVNGQAVDPLGYL
jgi:murein DD-endopeptidase MepM/ murein hydrolase activator NlpD